MKDRELLELAAKAGGLHVLSEQQARRDEIGCGHLGLWVSGNTCWNPLADDGDALRLAVKLKIHPETFTGYTIASYQPDDDSEWLELEEWGDDPYTATRRAITRAAAQLAQAQEGK